MAWVIMPYGRSVLGSMMDNVKELVKVMGGRPVVGTPKSDFDFINIIREGLPSQVIGSVVKASEISEEIIYKSLRIASRTAARRKASAGKLKPRESELVYRFSKVLVAAAAILGDKSRAKEWLLSENRALCGNRPIELLDTSIGFDDVMNVLHRIEHGVYS